jgi:uncharacterized repeat protein (TIGR02543 family)
MRTTKGLRTTLYSLLCIIIIFNLFQKTYAQAPEMEWHKIYNGSGEESHPHYVIESSDKGFVMIGETGFVWNNTAKIYVVKTDSLGQLEWEKELGTGGWNLGNCVVESDDGHFICAGSMDYNMALVKLNHLTGDTIWQKTWDLGTEDALEGVAVDASGDIIAVGYRDGLAENTFINWGKGNVIKTNTDGDLIYNIDISSYMSSGYRVVPIPGNQYMISGHPAEEGASLDYTLLKMDYNGNIIWEETPHPDIYWGFDVDSQGNMYLSGHTGSPLSNSLDICTVKIDSSGNELWKEYIGQPRGYNGRWIHDEIWGLRVTPDGGTIVCSGTGDEYSYSQCGHPLGCSDRWNVYLTKYSAQGTLLWEGLYADLDLWGGEGDNAGEDVCVTSDGGYLVANDVGGFGFTKIKPDTVTVPNFYKLSVDHSGNGIVYPYKINVTKGEDIEISATPDDGWQFDSWTGDITDTENPITITMDNNITVMANFKEIETGIVKKRNKDEINVYPNPIKHGASIAYYVSERSNVEVCIYNHLGRKTTTLISKSQSAGEHSIYWDAEDCSQGIYFYKIRIGNDEISGKMVLLN